MPEVVWGPGDDEDISRLAGHLQTTFSFRDGFRLLSKLKSVIHQYRLDKGARKTRVTPSEIQAHYIRLSERAAALHTALKSLPFLGESELAEQMDYPEWQRQLRIRLVCLRRAILRSKSIEREAATIGRIDELFVLDLANLYEQGTHAKAQIKHEGRRASERYYSPFFSFVLEIVESEPLARRNSENAWGKLVQRTLRKRPSPPSS